MILTPFTSLSWAYQLHYYLCFRTHRRRPHLASRTNSILGLVREICARHDYHLLECQPRPDHVRCLLSLQPAQPIARVMQTIKTNSSREIPALKPVWARGYLARGAGRMRIDAVRSYLEQQPKHHGYDKRILPPIYQYRASVPRELKSAHTSFDLSHHLVLATRYRKGVFTSALGKSLTDYWLKVADARDFAIDQVSVVPDHVHMIVRIVPRMSIEECTLLLMNNGQHFMGKKFPYVFLDNHINQLWEASAYAGTCGELTTALIKSWLRAPE
jgi:putative transposase